MTTLHWRIANVELREPLIPKPNSPSEKTKSLTAVRVAVEFGFLHIDPRPDGQDPDPGNPEYPVYIIPGGSVLTVVYQDKKRTGKVYGF